MLRTRLWVGTILILLTIGVLAGDRYWPSISPFLFALVISIAVGACHELLMLVDEQSRPRSWVCYPALLLLLTVNWVRVLWPSEDVWMWLASTVAIILLLAFAVEMVSFQVPGQAVMRIAQTLLAVVYLGLLPSFLVQLRQPGTAMNEEAFWQCTAALGLAIFVPKCCDIGAYFTGRLLGRHKMSPILSPGKTWEGAAGGVVAAVLAAIAISLFVPKLMANWVMAIELGLALAIAGIVGDLAESLIKRDRARKDSSSAVPGFGGILDVVDSILFAAPVAYWWLGNSQVSAAI
jgi:phosphatidate cytidylyltransferase